MTTTTQERKPKFSLLGVFLAGVASLSLIVCAPQASFAQRGGGGGHAGGGGGGSHGSSGGGFHGGSVGGREGGSFGGYHGSEGSMSRGIRGGMSERMSGGRPESMRRESAPRGPERSSSYGRADTSPGWHSLGRSSAERSSTGRSGSRTGASGARGAMEGRGATSMHAALADGQWHSFGGNLGGAHAALGSGLSGNARLGGRGEFFHGGGWGGWRGGWGYPGYGFGFGCWGCGWGYGFGWGVGWNPYWALYPYPYWDSLWWGDPYGYFGPPDIYPYPY